MNTIAQERSLLSRLFGARETGLVLIILTLFVIMSFASPHFLTWTNMRAMTMAFSVEAIVVVGMTILLISGGIDLSVGSVTALAMVIAGLLFLNGGNWGGKQVVSAKWVAETTKTISATGEQAALFGGYGGLWWTAIDSSDLPPVLHGSFTASGFAGQQMTIIPSIQTIILTRAPPKPEGKSTLGNFLRWQELVLKTLEARIAR
jgi:ribose/xylose/arabinose/galactoside ABC-type transport system permease subunit